MNIKQLLCSVCLAHTPLIAMGPQIPLNEQANHTPEVIITNYERWNRDGIIINAEIERRINDTMETDSARDLIQRLFIDTSLDEKIFLYMCAKEEMNGNELLRSRILPTAWKTVNYLSIFGKRVVSAISPISSLVFVGLSALRGNTLLSTSSSVSENGTILSSIFNYPGVFTIDNNTFFLISQILNATSLISYQIGYNVSTNAYTYSSNMCQYFSNANFLKQYLQLTMSLSATSDEYGYLQPKYQWGAHHDLNVPKIYYDNNGPVATALLRDTMRQLRKDQSTMQEEEEAKRHTPKYFYTLSNYTSLAAGALYAGAGFFNILNSPLLAAEATCSNNIIKEVLALIQIPCAAVSTLLSFGSSWLWKKSAIYSRRYMLSVYLLPVPNGDDTLIHIN